MDRPILVSIIAIVMGLIGLLSLFLGLLFVFSPWLGPSTDSGLLNFLDRYVINAGQFTGAVLAIGGAAVLATALGLWHQESWSLWLCVGCIAFAEVVLFFVYVPFSYIFLLLLVLYVYLLAVRHHFR